MSEQSSRLLGSKTLEQLQEIEADHRELIRSYRSESILQQQLNRMSYTTSSAKGWAAVLGRKEFCGGLATVFLGTATVESDFSVLNYEKNIYRTALTDFSLEGILHCKQFQKLDSL